MMLPKSCYYFFILSFFFACNTQSDSFNQFIQSSAVKHFSLHIKNGEIIDGSGQPGFQSDLLIQNDKIVYIGKVDTAAIAVDQTIDAAGKVVTPGFIDIHSHGDPLETPDFQNFLAMGVTTISLGKDGFSPSFENIGAWMQRVTDTVPGVNVALFVGHSTLRTLTGVNYNPQPTPEMLEEMGDLLRRQLDAGCFGMTTGLEYIPGMYAAEEELVYLAKIVGKAGKIITSHMRNEDDNAIERSIEELLKQGQYCPVNVSHLKVVYGKGQERAEEILRVLGNARAKGIKVTADMYPYTASYTGIGILFPDWAKAPNDYGEVVKNKRKALADFLFKKVNARNGPEATLLGTAPFSGKTLAEIAKELNKSFVDVLIDDIGPNGASGAYFVMDEDLQNRILQDSSVMVSSDGSPTSRHPRGYGTFAEIIETYVNQKQLLSLEAAIRKMTSLPAQTMRLEHRGVLLKDKKADVLVFDPNRVKAKATYENPFQLAEGFDVVIVNGQISLKNGKFSARRHGQMLKAAAHNAGTLTSR